MFKNIQKYLLINHPLLWNTKIVPLSCVMIVFHIIFFIIGYINGEIDFAEFKNMFSYDVRDQVVIFFSVLTSVLSMIIWLVYYFKNNAFKSFYPKGRFSLYKEWVIQVVASLLICCFSVSYHYGKDVRARGYFSEEEATRRTEIISAASLFVEGSFDESDYQFSDSAGKRISKKVDHVVFKDRNYSLKSLMNKNIQTFSLSDHNSDSLRKLRLKTWLYEKNTDSIKRVFSAFLAISQEHNLTSNIDADKWFKLTVNYPELKEYYIVGPMEKHSDFGYYAQIENYADTLNVDYTNVEPQEKQAIDTINKYEKTINNQIVVFNKYYVPYDQLQQSYEKVANAWTNPAVDCDFLLIMLYVGISVSILIFSFRVTSGKNWLIALVSIGIINIIFGVLSILIRYSYTYPILLVLLTLALLIHFIYILRSRKEKGISGITLNLVLWLSPAFIPLFYRLSLEMMKLSSGYYSADYRLREKEFPTINMLEENTVFIFYANVIFIFLALLFLALKIKKWKGIAES